MRTEWYVVWVTTGKEPELLAKIRSVEGVQKAICPVRQLWQRKAGAWMLVPKLLFPSYIFIQCPMSVSVYHAIRELPGVLGWLGRDSLWPSSVRQEEMDAVLALESGAAPEAVLTDVREDKRQRRGWGTLLLHGKPYSIPYNVYHANQAEEPAGDTSPQDTPEPTIATE